MYAGEAGKRTAREVRMSFGEVLTRPAHIYTASISVTDHHPFRHNLTRKCRLCSRSHTVQWWWLTERTHQHSRSTGTLVLNRLLLFRSGSSAFSLVRKLHRLSNWDTGNLKDACYPGMFSSLTKHTENHPCCRAIRLHNHRLPRRHLRPLHLMHQRRVRNGTRSAKQPLSSSP